MRLKIIKTNWWVLIVGVLLISLRFYPAILNNKTIVFGDNYSLEVPEKIYSAYWLRQGVVPWWNRLIFAGIPWSYDLSHTFFYPTTGLFALLNPGFALNASIVLHLLFTYFGMFLLIKMWTKDEVLAVIGAIWWTFSTQVTGSANNLATIQAIAWFPWILYWGLQLFNKAYIPLIYGLFILGQLLAGYPQHVVYAIFLSVFLSAIDSWHKRPIKAWFSKWTLTGLVTLGITAMAWIPFIDPFTQSTRMLQSSTQAASGSLNPVMLVKFVLPYFFDNPGKGIKWGPAWSGFPNSLFYLTWVGLMGIFFTLRKSHSKNRALVIFIAASIILAMGDRIPGFQFVQAILPFFKFGRYPSMVLVSTNIALIFLAVQGLSQIKAAKAIPKRWVTTGFISLVVVGLLYLLLPSIFPKIWDVANTLLHHKLSSSPFHTVERDFLLAQNILLNFFINCLLTLAVLYTLRRKVRWAVLIIGLDMIFNTQNMLFFAPAAVYPSWSEIYTMTKALPNQLKNPQFRTITRNSNEPYTDFGMYWEALTVRAPFSDSFIDPKELQTYTYLQQLRDSFTPDWNMVYQIPSIQGYTTLLPQDFSSYWQTSNESRINFIDHINVSNPLLQLWSVHNYVVDKQFVIKEALPISQPTPMTKMSELYSLPALPRFRYEDGAAVDLTNFQENPNEIRIRLPENKHSSMIVADRYDPGWHVYINGIEKPVRNYQGMREYDLESGVNEITMIFIPSRFEWSLAISVITVAGSLLLL